MKKLNEFILYHNLDQHNIIQLIFASVMIGFVIFMLVRTKAAKRVLCDVLMEKKDGELKFSLTRFMMIIAFGSAISAFHLDEVKNGFNEMAWTALLIFAITGNISKACSEKINPTQPPPATEGKVS